LLLKPGNWRKLKDVFKRRGKKFDIFNFFIENMARLEENFLQIRDILKEELDSF